MGPRAMALQVRGWGRGGLQREVQPGCNAIRVCTVLSAIFRAEEHRVRCKRQP